MLAPIPWERHSGETVENVLATYICRLHPRAVRIRPSRGDHGIDLLEKHDDGTVTVYQVKKFATNLDTSHKRQIEKSLDRMQAYIKDKSYVLRAWHLVLPLDPTLENQNWFDELVSDPCFDMVWDGLTVIDGWAAQMPDVADYCLNANNGWVMQLARLHLEALGMEGDGGRDLVVQRLAAIQELLERTAPYYRYGIHLVPEASDEVEIEELMTKSECQPGLLMTQIYGQPGVGLVQIDVFARSAALGELHPITGNITLLPRDDDERRQVEDYVNYGVPIRRCLARVVETSGPFAFDLPEGGDVGDLSMLPHDVEQATPEVFLTTGDGCELAMFRVGRTSGEKGFQTAFTDAARMVSFTFRVDFSGDTVVIPEITTIGIEGKDCSVVRDALGFLSAAYKSGEVSVLFDDKVLLTWAMQPNDDLTRSIDELYKLASAVVAIGRCAHVQLPFPKIGDMTETQHAAILAKGKLADGKCIIGKWRDAPFKMVAYEEVRLEFPVIVKWLKPERVTIADVECDLGYSENIIVAGSLQHDVGDEAFSFFPRDAEGDLCVSHLLPTRSAAAGMVNQVYTTPYQDDTWDSTLRFAGYNLTNMSDIV